MTSAIEGAAYGFGLSCAIRYGAVVFGLERALLILVTDQVKLCGSFAYTVSDEGEVTLHDTQQYIVRLRFEHDDAWMNLKTTTRDFVVVFHKIVAELPAAPAAPAPLPALVKRESANEAWRRSGADTLFDGPMPRDDLMTFWVPQTSSGEG